VIASAFQSLSIGAGASLFADFRSHGFYTTASADRILQAAAEVVVTLLFELGLKVVLTNFGLDVLHAARAHLEVETAARILNTVHLVAILATAANLAETRARSTNLGLDGSGASAVANFLMQAATTMVGSFYLYRVQRPRGMSELRSAGAVGLSQATASLSSGILISCGFVQSGACSGVGDRGFQKRRPLFSGSDGEGGTHKKQQSKSKQGAHCSVGWLVSLYWAGLAS